MSEEELLKELSSLKNLLGDDGVFQPFGIMHKLLSDRLTVEKEIVAAKAEAFVRLEKGLDYEVKLLFLEGFHSKLNATIRVFPDILDAIKGHKLTVSLNLMETVCQYMDDSDVTVEEVVKELRTWAQQILLKSKTHLGCSTLLDIAVSAEWDKTSAVELELFGKLLLFMSEPVRKISTGFWRSCLCSLHLWVLAVLHEIV